MNFLEFITIGAVSKEMLQGDCHQETTNYIVADEIQTSTRNKIYEIYDEAKDEEKIIERLSHCQTFEFLFNTHKSLFENLVLIQKRLCLQSSGFPATPAAQEDTNIFPEQNLKANVKLIFQIR